MRLEQTFWSEVKLYSDHNEGKFVVSSGTAQTLLKKVEFARDALEKEARQINEWIWNHQEKPCSGSGYSHKPHGACPGYSTDRT